MYRAAVSNYNLSRIDYKKITENRFLLKDLILEISKI